MDSARQISIEIRANDCSIIFVYKLPIYCVICIFLFSMTFIIGNERDNSVLSEKCVEFCFCPSTIHTYQNCLINIILDLQYIYTISQSGTNRIDFFI